MVRSSKEFTDRLEAISTATDPVKVRDIGVATLQSLGVSAVYMLTPLSPDNRSSHLRPTIGLPDLWEKHYRKYLRDVDPLPVMAFLRSGAFVWPDSVDFAALSPNQRRYMDLAARYGLARGIGVACYGPHGRSAFVAAAWPENSPPQVLTVRRVEATCQAGFQRYCQLLRRDDEFPALSDREREVIGWMCEGKSNSVIAQIIGISQSTVDVYARRIFAKLGVSDRTAACMRALSLGLVAAPDGLGGEDNRQAEMARQQRQA